MTPESADSTGYGTKICPASVLPTGTASPAWPLWYCQRPLRLSQSARTICGRGYSGKALVGEKSLAQRVINGPLDCFHSSADRAPQHPNGTTATHTAPATPVT